MIQIFPDGDLVQSLLNVVTPRIYYNLFTNNMTPTDSSVIGDFTQAQLGAGPAYASQSVAETDFTLQGVAGHIGKITAPDIALQNLSGGSITAYGYLAGYGGAGGALPDVLLAARFDSAPITLAPGDTINVTPTLSLRSAS